MVLAIAIFFPEKTADKLTVLIFKVRHCLDKI